MTATESRPLQVDSSHHNGNGHTNGNGTRSLDRARTAPGARIPPHNLDVERDLLGAIMLSEQALTDARDHIGAGDFYKPAHQHIFDHACRLADRGEPVNPVILTDSLSGAGLLDQCGGLAGLTDLQAQTAATSKAGHYARKIAGHSLLRRLIGAAGEIAELGYSQPDDPALAVDRAEELVYALSARDSVGSAEPVRDIAFRWMDILTRRYEHGPDGIPTGIIDLDEALGGGLRADETCFVAARPAMGKSNVGIQLGYHIASAGRPSLVFSLEMPSTQLVERIVASQAKVDNQRLRTGQLLESDWPKVSQLMGQLADVPLYIHDASETTLATIRAQIRRLQAAAGPLGVVVVDYLQLLATSQRTENRQVEVDGLARGLKVIARSMKVPIVALCQVNRNVEARSDKRPTLADLRESGGIEAHGDVVIAVYRDQVYHPDSKDRGTAELILLKQREGPLRTVRVAYLESWGIFANMARV